MTVALFGALCVLRDAANPFARELAAEWRAIDAWVRGCAWHAFRDHDDVHQRTLLAIAENVRGMRATTPSQAAAWVSSVVRRKRIDASRFQGRDLAWKGMREQPFDGDPFSRIAAPEDRPTLDAEAVIALLEQRIAEHVSRTARPTSKGVALMQGRAAIRRLVLEDDADEIAAALGVEVSRDCLYKWTERGRAVVLAALDAWQDAPGELVPFVRAAMWERRADAGTPRPERRRAAA
jgi:hypothetical protein